MILFLDDEYSRYKSLCKRFPNEKILWVSTNEAFIQVVLDDEILKLIDVISLDHDLGFPDCGCQEQSSISSVNYLIILKQKLSDNNIHVNIHSWNPYGAYDIAKMLINADISHSLNYTFFDADPNTPMKVWGNPYHIK